MTISTTTSKNTYAGDGATTVFAYTFRILDQAHIKVELKDTDGVITTKTITTHYTVSGVDSANGGNITFVTAPLSTDTIILTRSIPIKQEVDYVENDTFPAETHETALDKLTMIAQELGEKADRTLKLDASISGFDATLPGPTADKFLKFNAAANALEGFTLSTTAGLGNVVEDLSPQLGGDLDANGKNILFDTATGLKDSSGNELITFTSAASAVNELAVKNAAAGGNVELAATGDDANIGMNFQAKGTGPYILLGTSSQAAQLYLREDTDNGTNDIGFIPPSSLTASRTVTLPDENVDLTEPTQAQMETGTSTTLRVSPNQQKFHPLHPKAWGYIGGTGTAGIIGSSGILSIVDNGTGDYTVNWTTNFSSVAYTVISSIAGDTANNLSTENTARAVGSVRVLVFKSDTNAATDEDFDLVALGDL
jgi:hypothetical protein